MLKRPPPAMPSRFCWLTFAVAAAYAAAMLLPVCVIDGFLGEEKSARLLDFAIRNQHLFAPSGVHDMAATQQYGLRRSSLSLVDGHDEALSDFIAAVDANFERLRKAVGVRDFVVSEREIDLVAHLDGHHYRRHVDILTQDARAETTADRMISLVYYVHKQPQAFSGGELDLFAIGSEETRRVEPRHDRLVAFSPMAPHEVRNVTLPGNQFADARFSVACWLCRARGGSGDLAP